MTFPTFNSRPRSETHLLMGAIVCTATLSGHQTSDQVSIIDMQCPAGCGPGPHTDPWRETFCVIEGELEFMLDLGGGFGPVTAKAGDVVSIPPGAPHAFKGASSQPARALIISEPAGLERFFAEAGELVSSTNAPAQPRPFDRNRLEQATVKYGIRAFNPAS